MAKTYTLTMSEEQSQLLVKALDLYSRIGIGQFEEILDVYDPLHRLVPVEAKDTARKLLDSVKAVYGHPANGSHGIHNPEVRDEFRAAYDIQRVVRHRLAFDRHPEGGFQVNFDEPWQISERPLPSIKSEDERWGLKYTTPDETGWASPEDGERSEPQPAFPGEMRAVFASKQEAEEAIKGRTRLPPFLFYEPCRLT